MMLPGPDRLIAAAIIALVYMAFCSLVLWRHRGKRRSPFDAEKTRFRNGADSLFARRVISLATVGGRRDHTRGDSA